MFSRKLRSPSNSKRRKQARQYLGLEALEDRRVLASAWHNAAAPLNVNDTDQSTVSPLDALVVINELTERSVIDETGKLPDSPEGYTVTSYFDVTDDGFVSPLDALRVINELTDATLRGDQVDAALEQQLMANPDLSFTSSAASALGYSDSVEEQQVGDLSSEPAVALTSDGGSVVVWVETVSCGPDEDCPTHTIESQRFAADGTAGDQQRLGLIESAFGNAMPVRGLDVDVDSSGEVFATWSQYTNDDWDIYLKRPGVAAELVNEMTLGAQRAPSIAVDANDDFLIVWQDDLMRRIRGRYYGSFETGEVPIESAAAPDDSTEPRLHPALTTAADGYFATWAVRGESASELRGLYLDPGGQVLSSVVVSDSGNPPAVLSAPSISTAADGTYAVVAWQQQLTTGSEWQVNLRGFDLGTGETPEVQLVANEATYGAGGQPAVAFDQGDILVAWNGYGLNDIDGQFVRRYDLDETSDWASTEANLNSSSSEPRIVASDETAFLASSTPENRVAVEAVGDDIAQVSMPVDGDDLVAFAKAIADSGAIFYGAAWCPHCTDQKELFEDGAQFLPFVEVTNPDRTPNQVGIDAGVTTYPTWVFADETRLEGVQSLETLAERTGVAIPKSDTPFIAPIDSQTLMVGSPLHVSLDGYDPNGTDLTFSASSDNPDVSVALLEGNQSIRFDVDGYGDMVFELFEQRVPRATDRMIELSNADFYEGIIFHRVINNFVIQAGDPEGLGSGGSDLGDFDDQFHVDLQHNRTGLLSMAKSSDDTNDSQFFVTEGPTRHLDFNHSIFGALVEGEAVRAAISDTETVADRPLTGISIGSTEVFTDTENGMLMLKAAEGATGTATITVTVTDADGMTFDTSFEVTIEDDVVNGGPFLEDFDPMFQTTAGVPLTFTLDSIDVEGDDFTYGLNAANATGQLEVTVDESTGEFTVTPVEGFVGTASFVVGVRAADGVPNDTGDPWDAEFVTIEVVELLP